MCLNNFMSKEFKKIYAENMKKTWEPFGSCLLNTTANPAHFGWTTI